jgi:hypothetical protein
MNTVGLQPRSNVALLLNGVITDLEVYEAIRNLKNNKAPGTDKILKEYLKHSPPFLVKIYCKLFNIVLNTGIIPENWTCGVIKPILKKSIPITFVLLSWEIVYFQFQY